MGYSSLKACVDDLERHGHLVRINEEIDPYLEAAEIHRRVYQAGGPALLFTRVKGTPFPMVSNMFGTLDRARFMFRDSLEPVRRVVELKVDPMAPLKAPFRYIGAPLTALTMLPKRVGSGPVLGHETKLSQLPQLTSWPRDGGPFITLPQVYTEDPRAPGPQKSNLGMYRVQIAGNEYERDREVGLHYQIHRGIGVHHTAALARGETLRANIFVGGAPAMALAAVMPLPEGLSELMFAGALNRRRVRLAQAEPGAPLVHTEADFVLMGEIVPNVTKPEGPFGDHLGYYSLAHPFPVLRVTRVLHRQGAIWPFTVVGRPPQEDTTFGALIHEISGPVVPTLLPGVREVHAVDATGVHPLLIAIGSERYTPHEPLARPQELLTQASGILGQGQMSLAKYVMIANHGDAPQLDLHDIGAFFAHMLERADWRRDLHFHTQTTIDTLDYSGHGLNQGSKLVIAAVGDKKRELGRDVPSGLSLPDGVRNPRVCIPGVLALQTHAFVPDASGDDPTLARIFAGLESCRDFDRFPLIVLCDDSEQCARSLENFLWITFTRSDPARDVHGLGAFTRHKHWGCTGSLVIDARRKPHHAPPLEEDPAVTARVDSLATRGGPLFGLF